ncbi:MAG: hypothetical protein LBM67_04665 [Lentimicrobiaceae bacterium]|jgi:type III secretory pathway component EscR|nr:hypothetical protein [Lentimicrobiaceae bacterium]
MKALFKIILFVFFVQLLANNGVNEQNDLKAAVNQEQKAMLHDSNNDFLRFVVNENSKKAGLLQFSNNVVPPQPVRTLSKRIFVLISSFESVATKNAFKFGFLTFDFFPTIKIFASSKAYFVLALRRIVI